MENGEGGYTVEREGGGKKYCVAGPLPVALQVQHNANLCLCFLSQGSQAAPTDTEAGMVISVIF